METSIFTTDDGRRVGVTEFGDPDAERTVVFCHPAPGSSAFDPDPAITATRRVRILALDRPGYGASQLHADGTSGTVADAASDIAAYLASRSIGSVGAAGWSAGGRVALALAALRPRLVDRVALIATPAPDEDVPWVGDDNRSAIGYLRMLPRVDAVSGLEAQFASVVGESPTGADVMSFLSVDPADDEIRDGVRPRLTAMLDRALEQGITGMAADIVSYSIDDWGFDPASVRAKTLLLYGQADQVVTPAHARWYRSAVADARVETVPDTGHLVIVPLWDRVLSHVAPGTRTNLR